jgi:hypothetical protein
VSNYLCFKPFLSYNVSEIAEMFTERQSNEPESLIALVKAINESFEDTELTFELYQYFKEKIVKANAEIDRINKEDDVTFSKYEL